MRFINLIDNNKKLLYNIYRKRKEMMLTQSSEKCVVDKDRKAGRRKTKPYQTVERSVVRFPLGTMYSANSLRTGIKIVY